ncbi:uncharacterized protein MONOS_3228 [Monocercomonoides exilis]|uniref:uncharacterized protein n=1 Tax=Monocercomonoides exilis TaxID=2049356 RepID=UPI0035599BD7|nr:hypothetical protein MONOS_3228 [Monocercomonoides exilis]|eukprot:MONOS_3228.1-p1 / transcript=MONOS_3228.1 / gene=MONOS_3228 / organism=Monocercomonoides_exilis_PA203 / gene_product=unspecified product / transcript_product=unspecified product / location=Mono_scaffold00074:96412-96903(-) / protein_length=164 / sequence_SO=supercontig / SO=protein_coding / is_pseudo=false
MQIAPPFEAMSSHLFSVAVVLDPFHSHQMNELAPLVVVFCLTGFNGTSAVPLHSTFLVRQHLINEVFEAVRKAKGLLREGTIPPSYTSHTDENEQLFIKLDVWVDVVVGDGQSEDAVEILKNDNLESETKEMEGDKKNGEEDEIRDSLTEILHFLPPSLPHAS